MSGTIGTGHVGGVDASIPLQAGRGVQNNGLMTQSPHDFANTLSSFNQLSLFPLRQQELQQQLELQRLGITKGGIENEGARLGLTQKQAGAAYTYLMPYANQEKVSFADIMRGFGLARNNGINVDKPLADFGNFPPPADGNYAPFLKQVVVPHMSESGQLTVLTPQQQSIAVGGHSVLGTVSPLFGAPGEGGTFTPKQVVTHTVGPEYRATPQTRQEGTKAPVVAPGQTFAPPETLTPTITPIGPGSVPTGPPAVVPGGAAPAAATTPSIPGAGGAPVSGMPPGAKEEIETSQRQYKDAADADASYAQTLSPLLQAEAALKSAKTGPGTDTANLIQSYIVTWAPEYAKSVGIDKDKVADFDSTVKFLAQTALGQPGALTSDMRTSLAQVANASTKIQPAAALHVVQLAIGLRNMQHGASYLFDKQFGRAPGVANEWAGFNRDYNRDYDPRGFYWDSQTQAQKQKVWDTASTADRARIAHSIELTREMGTAGGK